MKALITLPQSPSKQLIEYIEDISEPNQTIPYFTQFSTLSQFASFVETCKKIDEQVFIKVSVIISSKQKFLLIELLYVTGIRVSELQYITVEAVKLGEATVSCKAKTRSVFIVKELQKSSYATHSHTELKQAVFLQANR